MNSDTPTQATRTNGVDRSVRPDPSEDLATAPKQPDKSLGELFSEMTHELSMLVRKEVELAKVETQEEVGKAGRAAGMLAAGGALALVALLLLSWALAWLLDQAMNRALAFLIVGVAYAVVAGIMLSAGRARLKNVKAVPETTQSIREDLQWARTQVS